MSGMGLEEQAIRQRNDDLVREVRALRVEGRLRSNRGHRGALGTAMAAIRRLRPVMWKEEGLAG